MNYDLNEGLLQNQIEMTISDYARVYNIDYSLIEYLTNEPDITFEQFLKNNGAGENGINKINPKRACKAGRIAYCDYKHRQ